MRSYWDLMEEAHAREAERMAAADRARLRAEASAKPGGNTLTLRAASLLRQAADHLEARSIGTAQEKGPFSAR
jgi:hypothetical protein